jgi:hypothetical protein
MKKLLLALAAFAAVTTAAAQPGPGGPRYRPLDPDVRAALQHYCQIMNNRSVRNRDVRLPRVCYRYFPGTYQPPRRYPQ